MYTPLQERIIQLTEELIGIRSHEWNSLELHNILDIVLRKIPNKFRIEKFEKNGIRSALVYLWDQRPKKFRILFNCHLDVIRGKESQYNPYHKDDKIYWAGANDMKWNVTATLLAFLDCAEELKYPIALQIVTDEEVGGFHGTKFQVENGVNAEFVIATEPTNLDIVTKAKWVLWCKVDAIWKTSHGAYPWRWDNAISKILHFIRLLEDIVPNPAEEEWISTLNIARIDTENRALNKIPDTCSLYLDIRFIPGDDIRIINEIKKSLDGSLTLSIIEHEPSIFTESNNSLLLSLSESIRKITGSYPRYYWANGTSDARHFSLIWSSWIEFWSVWWGIWEDEEWVSISSLEEYYGILTNFLREQNRTSEL